METKRRQRVGVATSFVPARVIAHPHTDCSDRPPQYNIKENAVAKGRGVIENEQNIKPGLQDSVFIDMFEQDAYRLELFRTLHPEMTEIIAEDIQTITLKQVITNHQYNDLALLVKDRLMVFVEAQSTWSVNILIRVLLYLADTIQAYLHDRDLDIHDSKKLEIPKPEFYIIFTGKQNVPEVISLRKDFFTAENCPIDLEAKVFSAETEDIIGQYIIFCRALDDQRKKCGPTKEAAIEAIRICKDQGILVNYLKEHEKEVIDIMITLFDQEYAVEQYGRSQKKEGIQEGKVLEAVAIYREELELDDETIISKIMKKFSLTRKNAEEYVLPVTIV